MTHPDNGKPTQPAQPAEARPRYEPPKITTYTSEEILEQVGPARACTISDGNPI